MSEVTSQTVVRQDAEPGTVFADQSFAGLSGMGLNGIT